MPEPMMRDELFAHAAKQLSWDIAAEMSDIGLSPQDVVDAVLPKGSPGGQYHRPALRRELEQLVGFEDHSLDLVTCLQIIIAFGWEIGVLE